MLTWRRSSILPCCLVPLGQHSRPPDCTPWLLSIDTLHLTKSGCPDSFDPFFSVNQQKNFLNKFTFINPVSEFNMQTWHPVNMTISVLLGSFASSTWSLSMLDMVNWTAPAKPLFLQMTPSLFLLEFSAFVFVWSSLDGSLFHLCVCNQEGPNANF